MGRRADRMILELTNDVSSIGHAVDYLAQCCAPWCPDVKKLTLNFRVGLTEAISNAMLYGNGADPQKKVRVDVSMGPGHLAVEVTDEGRGFDPGAVPDPTTPENILASGGRGIFLMRSLMDEVRFNEAGNSVTLILRDLASSELRDQA